MWVGEGVVGRVGGGGRCVDRAGEPYTPTINICCCAVLGIHVAKPADLLRVSRLHYCTNSHALTGTTC